MENSTPPKERTVRNAKSMGVYIATVLFIAAMYYCKHAGWIQDQSFICVSITTVVLALFLNISESMIVSGIKKTTDAYTIDGLAKKRVIFILGKLLFVLGAYLSIFVILIMACFK